MTDISEMKCCICRKGPVDGVSLFRVNAKGVAGIWACKKDFHKTDGKPDAELRRIVEALEQHEAARKPEPERPMWDRLCSAVLRWDANTQSASALVAAILSGLSTPSAAVVPPEYLAEWQAAVQRIREGG